MKEHEILIPDINNPDSYMVASRRLLKSEFTDDEQLALWKRFIIMISNQIKEKKREEENAKRNEPS